MREDDTMQGAYSHRNIVEEVYGVYVESPSAAEEEMQDPSRVVLVDDPGWAVDRYSRQVGAFTEAMRWSDREKKHSLM